VASCLGESWPGPDAPVFEVAGEPTGAAAHVGAAAHEPVTVVVFHLVLAGQAGTLRLCLPQALGPVGAAGPAARMPSGPIEISVATAEIDLSASELADLAAGDILMTDTPAGSEVVVRVAGIPKFGGRLGTCNGQRAVTITRRVGDRDQMPQAHDTDGPMNS